MLDGRGSIAHIIKYQEPVLQVRPEPPLMFDVEAKIKWKTFQSRKNEKKNNKA